MKLGGFVIHGNERDTLGRCLDSLLAVCDEVVTVDSGATDGSAELARERGVRRIEKPWEGYGAARAAAARALKGCDFLFFLDADEWLDVAARERFGTWRASSSPAPCYTVTRRDWANLDSGRFLFAEEPHVRILRPERAIWTPQMIVHEALSDRGAQRSGIVVEHEFVRSIAAFRAKEERYALLWALQAHREGRRSKWPVIQAPAHALRLGLLKGALFRGGMAAWRLSWGFGRYHARKHELLGAMRRGAYRDLVLALEEGRLGDLYRSLPPLVASGGRRPA